MVTPAFATSASGTVDPLSADPLSALQAELTAAAAQQTIPASVQPPVSAWANGLSSYFSYLSTPKGRACFAMQTQVTLPVSACYWGDTHATRTAALIGDSQAFQWLPTLDAWGQQKKWKILVLAKASCRAWPSTTYLWSDHVTPYPQCPKFDKWMVAQLVRLKPKLTLLSSEIGALSTTTVESSAQVVTGVTKLKHSLAAAHTRLEMFQNTPWFWGLPASPECLDAYPTSVDSCAQPRAETPTGPNVIEKAMRDAISTIKRKHIATVVPVDNLMCSQLECPMLSGSILMYLDDAHITNLWATHVEPAFVEMITPLVKGL